MKKRSFFVRTLLIFKPFWKPFGLMFGILLTIQLFGVFSPFLLGKSVDAVTHLNTRATALYLFFALVLSFVQSQLLYYVRPWFEIKYLDDHINHAFSIKSLSKTFSFSIGQHVDQHSGIQQSVINKGKDGLSQFMISIIYVILPTILQIFVTLIILALVDWRVALVAATFAGIYLYLSLKYNSKFSPKILDLKKVGRSVYKLESELSRNATLVISEAQEESATEHFTQKSQEHLDLDNRTWLEYTRVTNLHRIFVVFGQYVPIILATYLIFTGKISTGMFVTIFAWIISVFSNITMMMNQERQMLLKVADINKFYELLDVPSLIDVSKGGRQIEPFEGKVQFKNVSFTYTLRKSTDDEDDNDDVNDELESHTIRDVNLIIPAGAKVGFVGVSGAGKSTIVNLMRRYYDPNEGQILIDDIPLINIDLQWLRSQIGNVEQRIEVFDRSIKDNILFGLPKGRKVSDDDIAKAIKDASLEDFIAKLPEGLNTIIGENGIKVSGGERQRIGIARALIKNPKILIFDEATSALDSVNEKLIHDAINRGSKGRTTIVIAHRLSTIMDADIIFVVDDGKVVASGTHEELQKKSKDYQKLIKHQVLAS